MGKRTRRGRPINGWLVIDKPSAMTSAHVVGVVKRVVNAQKAGHGGTLDPLATGILPIALGEATKTVSYVMAAEKKYRFTACFGEARDTDDSEGKSTARSGIRPDNEQIKNALPSFCGNIAQRPPDYAAVKVNGERAYDLARRGETVQLEERQVRVDSFDMIERIDADRAIFEVTCGKGAYIRSLARDLGENLGCFAHVCDLRRLQVGPFTTESSITLDGLRESIQNEIFPQVLVSVATGLADIPALAVTDSQAKRLCSGQRVRVSPGPHTRETDDPSTVKVLHNGELVALASLEHGELSPLRVFNPKVARPTDYRSKKIDVDHPRP
ncbi:MAG: tRNA pseudouridine(55) synthase TruB [Pseudomonadota bacterium]